MRWTLPIATLLVAFAAQAGDTTPAKTGRASVDANGDGVVTREEAKAFPRLDAQFEAADANKDGQLDTAELNAHRETMRGQMREHGEERWKAADKDGNGALSRDEASASMPHMAERFDKFDTNGDGSITRDEMHNLRTGKKHRGHDSE